MYGVVSLTNGKPVMTSTEGANAAVGYVIPLKIRKQETRKQVNSYIAGNS